MATDRDPYRVLGLSPSASQADIASAYRRLLRRHHPDTRTGQPADPAADEHLQHVLTAYALLRDPEHRAAHDQAEADRVAAEAVVPEPRGRRPGRAPWAAAPPFIRLVVVESPPSHPPATGLWVGPVRRHR
ncbi:MULTISPECIES: J domain-containing protein [unclassified Rhodococcus (in: high G+C Gram-positive bacteria)]|uniref:J domain-containing protein n=1 Tax=unclassified Rhodococcus (in: high G+C Gram-positive bacteria) TaxID=192944 RepID=UPI0016399036|nr:MULTISPECIES: J domain-containing protein [unclassified Rhodococcus (in: high G+C Gram-positive bacteria)]MBC2644475.1 J domain-containing protein [Rhodococcus sp. 3A]MBC2897837.1 J domain-containing protein [Rhodococcus sp. 4CII]